VPHFSSGIQFRICIQFPAVFFIHNTRENKNTTTTMFGKRTSYYCAAVVLSQSFFGVPFSVLETEFHRISAAFAYPMATSATGADSAGPDAARCRALATDQKNNQRSRQRKD
jgi:hypothetical protein